MNSKRPRCSPRSTAVLISTAVACNDDDNADSTTNAVSNVATTEPGAETTAPPPTEPQTTVPEPTEPTSTAPPSSGPADCADEPTEESADELLVGLSEDEATDAAEACGWILRVVRRDGEDLPATLDLRPDRVNVEVTDGEVTAIVGTG